MTRAAAVFLLASIAASPAFTAGDNALLHDDFKSQAVDPALWHAPTLIAPGDGTFVGRTQFRGTQDPRRPALSDGNLVISIDSHNPEGNSFLAGELISNQVFAVDKGIHIIVRARMSTPLRPGVVGGLFLYGLAPGSHTLHDEIDFELLSNKPDAVQTNIYGNEPLGDGHVQFIPYQTGALTDFHNYEIKWTPTQVSWLIDGKLVRTTTDHIPTGPMQLYFNIWAPDFHWLAAYSAALQPTGTGEGNTLVGSMLVESVTVRALGD